MKECFKNWVLTHEKLYKLIVFVIALVAFLAVTAHGCKTMKAEAAVDITQEIINKAIIVNRNIPNIVLFENSSGELFLVCEEQYDSQKYWETPWTVRPSTVSSGYVLVSPCFYAVEGFKYENGDFVSIGNVYNSNFGVDFVERGWSFVYSSMPVYVNGSFGSYVSGDVFYEYIEISDPVYLVNAPYFSHVSTEVQNPILLKNSSLSKMYTEIQFELMGQPMTPSGGYKAEFFVDVYLPSVDLLYDLAYVRMTDSAEFSKLEYNSDKEYQEWWLDVSRGEQSYKKFTLRFEQEYSHPIDGYVTLLLPHDYLLECIEAGYGSVSDMYLGQITENEWAYEEAYELLLKFMTVGQVGNIVHTYNYPDVYYGRYTTITYRANLSEPVITEYNDDYFATGGSDSVDKVVQEEINNAYNDIADKLQSDNQALQDMLDSYYRGENAFSDYNSSDVWSFLSDTTKGLVSVIPTLSGLAAVVGLVFGFMPIQISGMIMTLFVICIFTAIIRFIRG